jgi:hypothetical protein
MKIHVLQHSPINTLGTIEEYARIKGHRLESTRFYEAKSPPELDSFDLLSSWVVQWESTIMKKIPG